MTSSYEVKTILGTPRKFLVEERPIETMRLDTDNPRFRHKAKMSERDIERDLWEEPDTRYLLNDIKATKGLQESLYIMPDGLVKEGNRRLVCLRRLKKMVDDGKEQDGLKEFPKNFFKAIPVKVFPEDITQREIDVFLGREHVGGKKEWKAYNQADHIYRMWETDGMRLDQIAEVLSKSKPYIIQKKWAYEKTLEFLKRYPKRTIDDFSYLEELHKNKKRLQELYATEEGMRDFMDWVARDLLNDQGARDVRKLPEVLADPSLKEVFLKEGIKKANALRAIQDPSVGSKTFSTMKAAIDALRSMSRDEYLTIPDNPAKVGALRELYNEMTKVFTELKIDARGGDGRRR